MIIFDVLTNDSPVGWKGERTRLFLSDTGYEKALDRFLSLVAVLPGALQSFWPSLHPLDLLVGLCCGGSLRLAVYLKSKNAKKYRHGLEYGSARCEASRYAEGCIFTARRYRLARKQKKITLTAAAKMLGIFAADIECVGG